MSLPPAGRKPARSWLAALSSARFFTASALLHGILVILVGGVVLYHRTEPAPDFTAGDSSILADDAAATAPPEQPQAEELAAPQPTAQELPTPSLEAITTTSLSSQSALVPPPPAVNLTAKMGEMPDVAKSAADRMAGRAVLAGGGMQGGTMTTFFGNKSRSTAALVSTFYDLKQTSQRKPTGLSVSDFHKLYRRFVTKGWNESLLNEYFKSPQPMYSSQIMVPNMSAEEGPKAFGLEKEVQPSRWLVHYKGRVAPPADGTYHFVGAGDDVMIVRFNGKIVLDRCWYPQGEEWRAEKNYEYEWTKISRGFARSDALQLRAGQFYDMEVLIGEEPGGSVFACLMMEKEGTNYQKDGRGNPILPPFRVADQPMPKLTAKQTLPPYDAHGPVWAVAASGQTSSGLDFFHKE